ncbi:MAG: hypothetical protein AABN34_26035 [Acidobacteriota bacterium]
MRDEIFGILKGDRSRLLNDSSNSLLSRSAVDCIERGVHAISPKKVTRHTCPDEGCRTAFWLEIEVGLSYLLIIEVSKLGEYARVYWKRKTMLSSKYSSVIPPTDHSTYSIHLKAIEGILSQCGVILLGSDELNEEVPFEVDEYNPDDNATVGSLMFAPEYH